MEAYRSKYKRDRDRQIHYFLSSIYIFFYLRSPADYKLVDAMRRIQLIGKGSDGVHGSHRGLHTENGGNI